MKTRALGHADLQVAPLIFGGNVLGWTIDEKTSFTVLDAFIDHGFNCLDTADVYSGWVPGNQGGESETIIGKWMKDRKNRSRVVIATKVGMNFQGRQGLNASHIQAGIEGSLKRLQTDYVDLYQAHQQDEKTELDETLKAFHQIQASGQAKVIGASNYATPQFRKALETARKQNWEGYRTYQPGYNLYDRQEFEKEFESVCLENKISVISYYSLASGFLTGKYRKDSDTQISQRGSGVKSKYMNDRGFRILKALDQVAEDQKATPAQVALAWLIQRPVVTAPIVSATSVEQVHDIAKAANLILKKENIQVLDTASSWR